MTHQTAKTATGIDRAPFRRRTSLLASAVFVATLGLGVVPIMRASADTSGTTQNNNNYAMTAEGDGMYFEIDDAQLPATTSVVTSPYSAQAALNSTGTSTAFAGLPYPGPVVENLPLTVNGLGGTNFPPLPPLPGYVASSYPTKPAGREAQGPYLVQATSSQNASNASAGVGVSTASDNSQQISATAGVVANDDGSVSATASAGVDALKIGPIDALNFTSSAAITEGTSGQPKIKSSSDLGTFQVLGYKIGIDQDGFKILGANLPLPTSTVLSLVNSTLTKSNVEISYIPSSASNAAGTNTIQSFTSGHLRIKTVQNVPGQGPVTTTFTFGRVTVSATNAGVAAFTSGDSSGGPAGVATSGSGDASASRSTPSAPPSESGMSAALGPTGGDATGVSPPSLASPPSRPPHSLGGTPALNYLGRAARSVPLKSSSSQAIYLLLVVCAVAVFAGPQVIRYIGVQLRFSPK
jgi:hypothetical protein